MLTKAMRKIIFPTASLTILAVAGCTMAPDYERPASPVPQSWGQSAAELGSGAGAGATELASWESFFQDEKIRQLVTTALDNNRDMRIAALNVEALMAQYRIQRASLVPSVGVTGSKTKVRTPGDLAGGHSVISDTNSLSVGVTAWELDLFGRVRSLKTEALESYLASEQTRRSVQLTLVAEVAAQYMTRVALNEHLQIAQDTLDSLNHSLELTKQMREVGNSSEMDVQSAIGQVAQAKASVASYQMLLAQADDALALLVGAPVDMKTLAPADTLDQVSDLGEVAAGLPSDLLERRPDILAAEHLLKAANADIGAARAAFFPKIALTASAGTASTQLSGLFKDGSGAWTFAPSISLPIFAGGANKANLDLSKVEKRVEIATYEKAIQTAFSEVSDALVSAQPLEAVVSADQELVAAQQKRLDLATERYKNGVDSYSDVLLAQQSLYTARQSLVTAQLALMSNRVTLYKVLGGGWR